MSGLFVHSAQETPRGTPAENELNSIWTVNDSPQGTLSLVFNAFFNASHQVLRGGVMGDLHQHSYRMQIKVKSLASEQGQMIVPYEQMRAITDQIARLYEGRILNQLPPFQTRQPTTEELVRVIAAQLEKLTTGKPFQLIEVTLYESPTIGVTFSFKDR